MDWTWYLFGFKGRINRAKYWLAGLVVVAFMIIFIALVYLSLTISFVTQAMDTAHGSGEISFAFNLSDIFSVFNPSTWRTLSLAKLPMLMTKAAGTVFFLWIFLATTVKRLHDRDRSAWWMVPFFAVPGLYNQYSDLIPDSWFAVIPGFIVTALTLWGFVELYFLSGTNWTNRFGPNPLGKEQMRVRSAEARRRATTPWDQESEIELVPRKGPPPLWRVSQG